jgi:hypothetical protein
MSAIAGCAGSTTKIVWLLMRDAPSNSKTLTPSFSRRVGRSLLVSKAVDSSERDFLSRAKLHHADCQRLKFSFKEVGCHLFCKRGKEKLKACDVKRKRQHRLSATSNQVWPCGKQVLRRNTQILRRCILDADFRVRF